VVLCLATGCGRGEVLDKGVGVLHTRRATSELRTLLPLFQDHPEFNPARAESTAAGARALYTQSQHHQLEQLYTQVLEQRRVRVGC